MSAEEAITYLLTSEGATTKRRVNPGDDVLCGLYLDFIICCGSRNCCQGIGQISQCN